MLPQFGLNHHLNHQFELIFIIWKEFICSFNREISNIKIKNNLIELDLKLKVI